MTLQIIVTIIRHKQTTIPSKMRRAYVSLIKLLLVPNYHTIAYLLITLPCTVQCTNIIIEIQQLTIVFMTLYIALQIPRLLHIMTTDHTLNS